MSMMDATCPKCKHRIGWQGRAVDRPPCPKCGHVVRRAELEAVDRQIRELEDELEAEALHVKPEDFASDFCTHAINADKLDLVSLLERCYMFLADNSHEAEEDAAELMAAIEKAIDLNAG